MVKCLNYISLGFITLQEENDYYILIVLDKCNNYVVNKEGRR